MSLIPRSLVVLTTLAPLALSACVVPAPYGRPPGPPVVVARPAPPRHAPAHGYRRHHREHGVDMVFDTSLGVYVVVGMRNVYFHADHFYRLANGHFEISARLGGAWAPVRREALPRGLARKVARGRREHHHPARQRD